MTARELVNICGNCKTCYECLFDKVCEAYFIQFLCYPADAIEGFDSHCNPVIPKANSDIEIDFPKLVI